MSSELEYACPVRELPEGEMKVIALSFGKVLLCHTAGKLFAINEMCPHEEISLSLGCLKGHTIRCSLHGSRFDLLNGNPLEEPAEDPLVRYPVVVKDDDIWVGMKAIKPS